jgi:hypothetical protein
MDNKQCIELLKERLKLIELIQKSEHDYIIHYNEKKLIENEIILRNCMSFILLNKIFKTKYSYVIDKEQILNLKIVLQQLSINNI